MSELDDILDIGGAKPYETIKTEIKALFLELIGEDQTYKSGTRDSDVTKNGRIRSRNDYKAELRKKVGEL